MQAGDGEVMVLNAQFLWGEYCEATTVRYSRSEDTSRIILTLLRRKENVSPS
jgi:hypothetical protein